MKFTFATALTALAAASQVQAQISPLLAGPEPYSNFDAKRQHLTIQKSSTGKLGLTPAKSADQTNVATGVYIVEFDDNAPVAALNSRSEDAHHDAFHAHMKRAKSKTTKKAPKYKTRYEFKDARLFKGISVKLEDVNDVAALKAAPGVKSVTPARLFTSPAFKPVPAGKDVALAAGNGGVVPGSKVARDLEERAPAYNYANDTFSTHVMTGVDKLHAKGYLGKGMTIGVIDTGIDYTNPALNSGKPSGTACFGSGCQISGGRDFVGDNYTGSNNPVPDTDPFANCAGSGHGTHVSGIILARQSKTNTFTGVVPDAQIHMYRVFGCGEATSVSDDVLIQALTYAYFDGVDVISMSIGGAGGWEESPAAAVASRISHLGLPTVIANGNDGANGAFYGSSPVSGKAVVGVGSVDNTELAGYTIYTVGASGAQRQIVMLTPNPWNETGTLPLKPVSLDPNVMDDGCDATQVASRGSFAGTVALVGRGTCTFVTKFDNLYNAGARNILIYNTPYPAGYNPAASDHDDLEVATISRDNGLYLKAQVAAGNSVSIDFSRQVFAMQQDNVTGGLMSDFSTTSPFWELSYGPQISAPGGNILSTWPVTQGTYAFLSGTSMATPFIAGSIAMYQSIKGKSDSSTTIRGILADTAKPINVAGPTQGTRGPLDTIAKQGGGLVDVYKAVFHTSRVSPNLIALNDTRFFAGKQTVTISNVGQKTQKYTLSHAPAGTLSTVDTSTGLFNGYPVPISNAPAKVTFSAKSVTISPGQSKSFTVTFAAPSGLDPNTVPVYSGFINLDSDSSPMRGSLSIPYMGVADDTYTQKILDTTSYVAGVPLPALVDANGNVITDDSHTFTLAGTDVPSIAFRLRWGTAIETIDLLFANTTFQPTVPINDPSASGRRRGLEKVVRRHDAIHTPHHNDHHARAASLQYSDVQTVGNVGIGQWVPRDTVTAVPSVPMTNVVYVNNGTTAMPVQDGQYKLLLRVRKQFHTFGPESSYESYLSHAFTVQATQAQRA